MSSANCQLRWTIQFLAIIAFGATTGCASMISSLADPSLEKQFPRASAEEPAARYETPIPHQHQAATPTNLRAQQRQFDRVATLVEVFDNIRWGLANVSPFAGPFAGKVTVTSTADKLCDSGSGIVAGMGWSWGAATLQPMAITEAVVRSRCRTAFRDHFLR
jgi:hypothetical protein